MSIHPRTVIEPRSSIAWGPLQEAMADPPLVFAFDPDEDFDPFKQQGLWTFFAEQGESWRLGWVLRNEAWVVRVLSGEQWVCVCWVMSDDCVRVLNDE